MDPDLARLAEAVHALYDPRTVALERLRTAVNGIFTEASARPGGDQSLHLRLADVNAQARALRARAEARYGPAEGLFDRMQARGSGLSARVWC